MYSFPIERDKYAATAQTFDPIAILLSYSSIIVPVSLKILKIQLRGVKEREVRKKGKTEGIKMLEALKKVGFAGNVL